MARTSSVIHSALPASSARRLPGFGGRLLVASACGSDWSRSVPEWNCAQHLDCFAPSVFIKMTPYEFRQAPPVSARCWTF
ncbi:hypothetical protein HFN89_01785 [Rhizobium laguerreae]|nr:hypothetical protein [Rhizobium laguerreae]